MWPGVCSPPSTNIASIARTSSPSVPPSVFERPGMSSASPCTTAICSLARSASRKFTGAPSGMSFCTNSPFGMLEAILFAWK